jgi:organic radical activating enzyme
MNKKCVLVSRGITVHSDGSIEPCCQYNWQEDWNNRIYFYQQDKYKEVVVDKIQQDIINGVAHPGCSKCHSDEELGIFSLRNYANQLHHHAVNANNQILDIELRLSNVCNLKCLMCHPISSSLVAAERHQHREKFKNLNNPQLSFYNPKSSNYFETQQFRDWFRTISPSLRKVHITGGEPFLIPTVTDLLNQLLPMASDILLGFNTNLTLMSADQIKLLQQFPNLNLSVSLEGVGPMNDWIRYPSRWNVIDQNINLVKEKIPSARLLVHHVLQHTSVHSLPGLLEYCKKMSLNYMLSPVQSIDCLSLDSVLPEKMLSFINWAQSTEFVNSKQRDILLTACSSSTFNPRLHKEFIDYVTVIDQIRDTNFNLTFNI